MQLKKLKRNLAQITNAFEKEGFSEMTGYDPELRPAYVIMQSLIEKCLAEYNLGSKGSVKAYIITPRMPTPLMFSHNITLKHIDLSKSLSFALLRNIIAKTV